MLHCHWHYHAQYSVVVHCARFDGLTGGNISVAQAAIADISTPESKSAQFWIYRRSIRVRVNFRALSGRQTFRPKRSIVVYTSHAVLVCRWLNLNQCLLFNNFFPETLRRIRGRIHIRWLQSFRNVIFGLHNQNFAVPFISTFLFPSRL